MPINKATVGVGNQAPSASPAVSISNATVEVGNQVPTPSPDVANAGDATMEVAQTLASLFESLTKESEGGR